MRRSQAPSQGGGRPHPIFIKPTGLNKCISGVKRPPTAYDVNSQAVKDGDVAVVRMPFLAGLCVPPSQVHVAQKFKNPSAQVSETALSLRKVKTLGCRALPGILPRAPFRVVSNLVDDEVPTITDEQVTEVPEPLLPAVAEVTWEPLVLWKGEIEKDGEVVEHMIEVPAMVCAKLRQHQREGVEFMFQCVMGLRKFAGQGCILADDMGLGKTLQSIALMYTLIKGGFDGKPTVKRAMVVCPCSLVKNWNNEIVKWLEKDLSINRVAVGEDTTKPEKCISKFFGTKTPCILIISYETFRLYENKFNQPGRAWCDLLICDEAHRLKNNETATNQALNALDCTRRILLSGTPLQNDLDEFYAMVDFANPGILGTPHEFHKKVAAPILAGREPDATKDQLARANQCQYDMSALVNEFILRRTNTLNAQHLPPKLVQIVCCPLTEIQQNIYRHLLSSKAIRHILDGKQTMILSSIGALQKCCNHPSLLQEASQGGSSTRKGSGAHGLNDISRFLPHDDEHFRGRVKPVRPELSGKFMVLHNLMKRMRATGDERIVIVSNYTQTLDLIGNLCRENNWPFLRLDGTTTLKKRQKMVDEFNNPLAQAFAFLLSSKAGGCGLNLIGGNRLVLFDPDWNPAVDKQAAARVWRDGQKRRCFIYRFVSTGTIEEKIFMRQLSKEGLQSIVEDKQQVNSLSSKDLRQLFLYKDTTASETHAKLSCRRCPPESKVRGQAAKANARAESLNSAGFNTARAERVKSLVSGLKEWAGYDEVVQGLREVAGIGAGAAGEASTGNGDTVVELLDLDVVTRKLDGKEYETLPAFSKHMLAMFRSSQRKAGEAGAVGTQGQLVALERVFQERWGRLVPEILMLKDDEAEEEEVAEAMVEEKAGGDGAQGEENEEEGDLLSACQPQVEMPTEEDLKNWSHHWSVKTIDDATMREALEGREEAISFVFGLEVTWDLLQRFPQPEQKPRERPVLEGEGEAGGSSDEGAGAKPKRGRGRPLSGKSQPAKRRKVAVPESEDDESSDSSGSSSSNDDGDDEDEEEVKEEEKKQEGAKKGGKEVEVIDLDDTDSDEEPQKRPTSKATAKKTPRKGKSVGSSEDEEEEEEEERPPVLARRSAVKGPRKVIALDEDEEEDAVPACPPAQDNAMDVDATEEEEEEEEEGIPIEEEEAYHDHDHDGGWTGDGDGGHDGSDYQEEQQQARPISTAPTDSLQRLATQESSSSCSGTQTGGGPSDQYWSCARCTFDNALNKRKCAVCGEKRPPNQL